MIDNSVDGGCNNLYCKSNLEEVLRTIERTNSGISELYNKLSEHPSRQNSSYVDSFEREEIVLSVDKTSASVSSTPIPKNQLVETHDVRETAHVGHVASQSSVSINERRINLCYFIWLKLIYAYDSGAFSAAVGVASGIIDEWKLSTTEQGALISSVFLGTVFGCLLSGHLFSIYNQKKVLVLSLIAHTISTFFFALLPFFILGLVIRFLLGITLSFIVVYVPVWVEEFAPKGRESIWMGLHNAAVPIGIIFGYLVCAYFTLRVKIGWEYAFYIKCFVMIPTIVCLLKIDSQSINASRISNKNNDSLTSNDVFVEFQPPPTVDTNTDNKATKTPYYKKAWEYLRQRIAVVWKVVHPLLYNTIFMLSVFIMCMMYFVATGLQNFLTLYLREDPFNASMATITIGFGISILTAPVLGVIVGAVVLDLCGGYSDDLFRVGVFGLCWSIPGSIFSTVCIFLTNPVLFIIFLALMLFCGGAIIPFTTGLTMCSLPEDLRPAGAAFSQIVFNLFGSFSGPMICSLVAEAAGGLKYGITTLLLSTNIGVILMGSLFFIAMQTRDKKNSTSFDIIANDSTNDTSQSTLYSPSGGKVVV